MVKHDDECTFHKYQWESLNEHHNVSESIKINSDGIFIVEKYKFETAETTLPFIYCPSCGVKL